MSERQLYARGGEREKRPRANFICPGDNCVDPRASCSHGSPETRRTTNGLFSSGMSARASRLRRNTPATQTLYRYTLVIIYESDRRASNVIPRAYHYTPKAGQSAGDDPPSSNWGARFYVSIRRQLNFTQRDPGRTPLTRRSRTLLCISPASAPSFMAERSLPGSSRRINSLPIPSGFSRAYLFTRFNGKAYQPRRAADCIKFQLYWLIT